MASQQGVLAMHYTLDTARVMKLFMSLGVIFGILLLASGILALGVVLYALWTMPFLALVEMMVRFFLISLILYAVYRGVCPLVRSFRR